MTKQEKEIMGIVGSDLPKSEVIATLSKRVLETETNLENYDWVLAVSFIQKMVFDGLKDYNYVEYVTEDSGTPYADTTIDDFNATSNKALRETVEATEQSNVKTKILDSVMINFKTNPKDTITAVFQNTENIRKIQGKIIEIAYWDKIEATATVIDTSLIESDIDVNKLIYKTLLEMETTTKNSPYIGTDGVITIDGETIQPSHRFDSSQFIYVTHPDFETNTVFDGERSFFNWNGKQLPLAKVITLDAQQYEGMSGSVKTFLLEYKAILIHVSAMETIMDWEATKIVHTAKLYQIVHNYLKYETYKRLDRPIIVFAGTYIPPETLSKNSKQEDKQESN